MDAMPPSPSNPVPPPLLTAPVFGPQDASHLRALSIGHYVVGALIALFSLIFIIHIVLGVSALTGALPLSSEGQPSSPAEQRMFGWMFTIIGSVIVVGGVTLGAFVAYAGRCLAQRRRYVLCLVVAGLSCLFTPVGTVLGVFTLIALLRPQVKAVFDTPSASV
ncbi:hypothetical protein ABE583_09810 [Stenotrophomonas sp. TWI143]|jgi:hypothetical protein|uniref:Transmembrane protein n=1 Tax=Stenotrophomonas maltophilia TaxID=40324 RepID=A0AAP7GQZ1_STEMA|nr:MULTISPECIES: hypothetical protein [Stenotrophomonas]KOQ68444.1 membrane protein [Stenotrophomonas maltophilia]MBA0220506.1 hypothetical protein [Stenotrophomonas maltophilia]MBE5270782.1 hypothetical protein [Stenotrophomonas sp. B2]MBH1592059.1 hypothetical protein [Stenotrophomonas maltophilia]MBH1666121.1 hypothetical protein [Stenotrophomonas maltophilia]